jgi:hypothetical protein
MRASRGAAASLARSLKKALVRVKVAWRLPAGKADVELSRARLADGAKEGQNLVT